MLPYKNKNFGSTLQLLEEEMAQEYGDEQPFIDPRSQAYEAFDYQEPQDNGSSEGKAALMLGLLCCPRSCCRPHSWGQAAQACGTRGAASPSPMLSSLWRCWPPTISGTRICVR